ncbi:tetratricopeptide repeat protein [Roseiconus nitratireducens]|nr:tetratricopeptide repeat protein [Roseiconus nitratireducens]
MKQILRTEALLSVVLLLSVGGCVGPDLMRSAESSGRLPTPTADQVLDVQLALARTLEKQGDLAATEAAYRKILAVKPNQLTALHRLAVLLDQRKRYEESAELFVKAIEQQPQSPDLYCDLGYSCYLQGRFTEAETYLNQAIRLDAYHERAHNHLGMLLAQTDRVEDALAEFQQAGCNDAESHLNLALAFTHCNRIADAHEAVRIAKRFPSGNSTVNERLGRMESLLAEIGQREPSEMIAAHSVNTAR